MIKLFNIDNKIPILIECFVEFYGEKYRDIITEKLSNTDIYFYRSPDNLKQSINTEYRNLLVEQEKTFLDKCNVPCNDDLLRAISFGDIEDTFFKYLYSYWEKEKKGTIKDFDTIMYNNCVKTFFGFLGEYDQSEKDKFLENLKANSERYTSLVTTMNNFKMSNKEYYDYINQCRQLKEKLTSKSRVDFLLSIKDALNSSDLEKVMSAKDNPSTLDYRKLECNELLFSASPDFPGVIAAFSSEANKILESEGNEFSKMNIMENRITYFKRIGLDLGKDYDTYKNNEDAVKLTPKAEIVDSIEEKRIEAVKERDKEFIMNTTEYKSIEKNLSSKGFHDDTGFDHSIYSANFGLTFVGPNYVIKDGKPFLKPNVFISQDPTNLQYLDMFIIHELNHVVELELLEANSDKTVYRSGFDMCENYADKKLQEEADGKKRNYELFNEIINQKNAEAITTILHDKGIALVPSPEGCYDRGNCSYTFGNILLDQFYDEYKSDLAEARINGNLDSFYQKVGRENIESLNDLCSELLSIPQSKRYSLFNYLENGIENDLTRQYQSIIDRKNFVYGKINEKANSITK